MTKPIDEHTSLLAAVSDGQLDGRTTGSPRGYHAHAAMTAADANRRSPDDVPPSPPPPGAQSAPVMTTPLEARLYVSHFLSTWNSRLFEFAAVLFLASIYPDSLMPVSVYALLRSAAAVIFARPVGSAIDRWNRLNVVRLSIVGQRLAVVASCGGFWVLEQGKEGFASRGLMRGGLFAMVVCLACVEKVAAVMNLVAVERDWVVVITEGDEHARRAVNARMRRIDLFCKLVGPLAVSLVAVSSTLVAIWTTLAMNIVLVAVEYICIAQVYHRVPALHHFPQLPPSIESHDTASEDPPFVSRATFRSLGQHILPVSSLSLYVNHSAFMPSISLALLYLTVLSFNGQLVTYLISVGYSPFDVGVARTVSTLFELSATWIAPRLMSRIGMVRGGIWSLSWQMIMLAAGTSWFFSSTVDSDDRSDGMITRATGLAIGVALSRVGLWCYDLCAQNIVQDEVEADTRGTFSTVEVAFQNIFELLSYTCTIIWSRPDQFQWPVIISVVAVYTAGGLYACFVRKRRGHLFHPPRCVCEKAEEQQSG